MPISPAPTLGLDNDAYGNVRDGFQIVGPNATIAHNVAYDNGVNGIEADSGTNDVIISNDVYANATGIYATDAGTSTSITISDNQAHDNSGSGITTGDGDDGIVAGNTIFDNASAGISMNTAKRVTMSFTVTTTASFSNRSMQALPPSLQVTIRSMETASLTTQMTAFWRSPIAM